MFDGGFSSGISEGEDCATLDNIGDSVCATAIVFKGFQNPLSAKSDLMRCVAIGAKCQRHAAGNQLSQEAVVWEWVIRVWALPIAACVELNDTTAFLDGSCDHRN